MHRWYCSKISIQYIFRLRVAEYEGSERAGAADPGRVRQPRLQLRAGRQQALLGEVVQGRPGVLQVHAQHGHADRGLPSQGGQCGGELWCYQLPLKLDL